MDFQHVSKADQGLGMLRAAVLRNEIELAAVFGPVATKEKQYTIICRCAFREMMDTAPDVATRR